MDKGLGYSAVNTARSSLSTFVIVDGVPVGQHYLVRRFMRATFNERPALPRNNVTWDVQIVLNFLRKCSPVRQIPIAMLTKKLLVLMLLLSGQRGQTVHLLDIRNMTLGAAAATFRLGDPVKATRPGQHIQELKFKAYAPDRRLCVLTVLKAYLSRTLDNRGKVTRLFITTQKPFVAASRDTLRRWTRDVLAAAGIDMNIFTPHSTRAAATSQAVGRVPLDTILKTAGWSQAGTFQKYYNKTVQKDFQSAILESK